MAVAAFVAWGSSRSPLALALSVGTTELAVALLKATTARPRPPAAEAITNAQGFSFPSGHAAAVMAIAAIFVFWLARSRSWRGRLAIAAVGAVVPALMGASRVYLGVHYPTDVIAGWLLGLTATIAVLMVVFRPRRVAC